MLYEGKKCELHKKLFKYVDSSNSVDMKTYLTEKNMLTLEQASRFLYNNWTDIRINEIFNKVIKKHTPKNFSLLLIGSPNDFGDEEEDNDIEIKVDEN